MRASREPQRFFHNENTTYLQKLSIFRRITWRTQPVSVDLFRWAFLCVSRTLKVRDKTYFANLRKWSCLWKIFPRRAGKVDKGSFSGVVEPPSQEQLWPARRSQPPTAGLAPGVALDKFKKSEFSYYIVLRILRTLQRLRGSFSALSRPVFEVLVGWKLPSSDAFSKLRFN